MTTGGAAAAGRSERRWDVALSFASARRGYVERVAAVLAERGVRCFYDTDQQTDLSGRHPAEELPAIYTERVAAVVVFVCAEYVVRDWTRLERRDALSRAVTARREYVLPARFDDTPLPGLLSDMVAADLRTWTPEEFAAVLANKLARLGIIGASPSHVDLAGLNSERAAPPFTEAEQVPAQAAVVADRWLSVALDAAGYGLTQTPATAPQLIAHWENALTAQPYAWAVLTAAVDATRLGADVALPYALLRRAAHGYCTAAQWADAPVDWFEQALTYATRKLPGAAATLTLTPAASAKMGRSIGYKVADHLLQHASRIRAAERIPASVWDALLGHLHNADDCIRVADSACERLLYRYAVPLYRRAADTGNHKAADRWVSYTCDPSGLDALRRRVDEDGDWHAQAPLADALVRRGELRELWARATDGSSTGQAFMNRLACVLIDYGYINKLHDLADKTGDVDPARELADLFACRGDLDGLRARAAAEAAPSRGTILASGDDGAGRPSGRTDQHTAACRLARFLAHRGDFAELNAIADDDTAVAEWFATFLAHRHDLDGLRRRADAGDRHAGSRLANLLVHIGGIVELKARALRGDEAAPIFRTWGSVG